MAGPGDPTVNLDTITGTEQDGNVSCEYVTIAEIAEGLRLLKTIPDKKDTSRTPETVSSAGSYSAGDTFYLAHANVLQGTYTLSYGASATNLTSLTETTDYTIDKDEGKIVLTSTGASTIGTDNIYATYSYCDEATNTHLGELRLRAQRDIYKETGASFCNPIQITREEQLGKGRYRNKYSTVYLPPFTAKTQLSADCSSSATEISVDSTTGFEQDDYITIGSEILQIDYVNDSTTLTVSRANLGSTAAAHSTDDYVVNAVFEMSTSERGSTPSYVVKLYKTEWDIEKETGLFVLVSPSANVGASSGNLDEDEIYPLQNVPSRVRLTYKYGSAFVPEDIKRLTILYIGRYFLNEVVVSSLAQGNDGFTPTIQEDLDKEIERILARNRYDRVDNL